MTEFCTLSWICSYVSSRRIQETHHYHAKEREFIRIEHSLTLYLNVLNAHFQIEKSCKVLVFLLMLLNCPCDL